MMTLRPLRPSQIARHLDDDEGDETIQASKVDRRLGPITTSAVLPKMKPTTCSQCRARKVRCDGREGLCQNCQRLGFECSFQRSPGRSLGRLGLKSPERRRRMQACILCRTKKTRCHGELPRCSNCVRKGRECIYPAAKKKSATVSTVTPDDDRSSITPGRERPVQLIPRANDADPSSSTTRTVSATPLLDITAVVEYIEDYFNHLYPLPSFAFLHKPTVIRRCRDGTINEPLKLAICAITSLHLQRAPLYHHLWAQQAEQLILRQISRPSIFHLQALLLVVRYRIESGEFPTAFMLAALAARTAVALRLNYERSELAPVAQEARRRLFWALYLLDDYFCVGLREFELCPEETIHLQLPCREEIFEAGQPCQTGMLRPGASDDVSAMGLRGAFMRLTSARRAIMRFNRRVGLGEESPSTIAGRIRLFEQELANLQAALSPEHQYSVSNLASCEWPAQFVMLHMSYHQCHCDIYRIFLNGYSEAAPRKLLASISAEDRMTMQAQCLKHAESILLILNDFLATRPVNHKHDHHGPLLLERDAAVCAFESARLVMFGARLRLHPYLHLRPSSTTSTLETCIRKAREISLRFITSFFPYSASTRSLKTALEHLIASYTTESQSRSRLQLPLPSLPSPPNHTPDSDPDPEPTPATSRPSTKISQYANSRQRLSVQSLLLQSDFADDSHEIAGPGPNASSSINPDSSFTSKTQPTTHKGTTASAHAMPYPRIETRVTSLPSFSYDSRREEGSTSTRLTSAAPPNPPSSYLLAAPFPASHSLTAYPPAPQPSQPQLSWSRSRLDTSTPISSSSSPSPWGSTLDACREDAGLIFNPWMGFPGTDEFHGLLDGLGGQAEDY
ncbi:hypothetical protein F5Y14DRAFT_110747 [Nemania sp. NC0429]|nr:hypothetical protein F5Y14DRAFT_110747 [Nemania sp. NC0429]